jgi:hypothetical protein
MRQWVLAVVIAASTLGSMPSAVAVAYEPVPPFCRKTVLHDYLRPLKRMPTLHEVPASGQIGFGPSNLLLQQSQSLVVGEGEAGYTITPRDYRGSPAHPRWNLVTTLSKVDWRGRPTEILGRSRERIATVGRDSSAGPGFQLDMQGVYRIAMIIRNRSGHLLRIFGHYVRVVKATRKAQLGTDRDVFRPGETVFARVENFGTATALFGAPYRVEKEAGSSWVLANENPQGPWIMPLYLVGPGSTSRGCAGGFWIPPTMSPGRYRIVKSVEFAVNPRRRNPIDLYGEFEVLP